jgi:hypothetical protein
MLELTPIPGHAVVITIFVFTMMLLVDYFNVLKLENIILKRNNCFKSVSLEGEDGKKML